MNNANEDCITLIAYDGSDRKCYILPTNLFDWRIPRGQLHMLFASSTNQPILPEELPESLSEPIIPMKIILMLLVVNLANMV